MLSHYPQAAQRVSGSGGNPLEHWAGAADSRYIDPSTGRLRYRSAPEREPSQRDREACELLSAQVLDDSYPCLMARSVFTREAFRLSTYGTLGDPANAPMLCHDLYTFGNEFPAPIEGAVSFVACFDGPMPVDEKAFETLLWQQLQAVHELDRRYFAWAPEVDAAPDSPAFSFSVGGRAFFLIGMHPQASRLARRLPMAAIVFNLHEQFVDLRATGNFDAVRDKVRARDLLLQGSINPMAADFGARSEAAQYSGRAVGKNWACPFNAG